MVGTAHSHPQAIGMPLLLLICVPLHYGNTNSCIKENGTLPGLLCCCEMLSANAKVQKDGEVSDWETVLASKCWTINKLLR